MLEESTSTSSSSSKQLTVSRPTRGSDRNQTLVDRADPASDDLLLPSLDSGITLLDIDGSRGVPILQSLVLDHLLLHDGPAFWVDANGYATTTALARIAPSQRLLDRTHVARGFTAYQHYGAVCDLPTAVNQSIQQATTSETESVCRQSLSHDKETSPQTPSLIVVPAIDAQCRTDDTPGETDAQTLQARTLARLTTYAEGYDVPILVTRSKRDEFTASVETAADHHLECEQTRMGPRFVGDEFETLMYPVDGAYYQTTFAYWRQLLGARAEQVGLEATSPSNPTNTTAGVGTGVTVDGETTTLTANPLLDAWTGTAGAGGQ